MLRRVGLDANPGLIEVLLLGRHMNHEHLVAGLAVRVPGRWADR
jgi:hypothetical protein